MPVKKSTLERKWYYRAAKVFFLLLPLLILFLLFLVFFLKRKVVVCSFVEESFLNFPPTYLIFLAIAVFLYYLVLKWAWKGFLYIVYGGVEDDTKKDNGGPAAQKPKQTDMARAVPFIILFIILAIMFLASQGYIKLPKIDVDSGQFNSGSVTCYKTSAEWGYPCRSVSGGVGVAGLPVPDSCDCPTDTTYAGMDNTAAGGPYKICTCN